MAKSKYAQGASHSSVHLDAIRGAAAVAVLLGHTRNLFFTSLTEPAVSAGEGAGQLGVVQPAKHVQELGTSMGNEAVVVFFILSGYLVGGSVLKSLRRGTWSWKTYLIKRMTRLWVVLLPALLLGLTIDFVGLHLFTSPTSIYAAPSTQTLVPTDIASRLTLHVILGNAFFFQTILVGTAGSNNSLWSLANEFWYYLAFPICLLATRRHQAVWVRIAYVLALAGMFMFVGKTINQLFLIWMLGAVVSILPHRLPNQVAKVGLRIFAIALPFVLLIVRRQAVPLYTAEWIVGLCFALVLYLVLHQKETTSWGFYPKLAGFFSRISYTLYLVHLPLAVFLCACINHPWHSWQKTPLAILIYSGVNAVIIAFSYCFYLAFEANTDAMRRFLFERNLDKAVPSVYTDANASPVFAEAHERRIS